MYCVPSVEDESSHPTSVPREFGCDAPPEKEEEGTENRCITVTSLDC